MHGYGPRVTQRAALPLLGYALRANPTYASSTSGRGVGGVTGLLSRCYDTAAQSESGQPSRLTGATGTHG